MFPQVVRRWAGPVLALAAVLIFVGPAFGRELFLERAPRLDGTRFECAALKHPTLVYFWATWCGTCRIEQPIVQALAQEYPVETIAVFERSREHIARYVEAQHVGVRVIADESGEIAQQFNVHAVPSVFVLDRHGRIRFRITGYATSWGLRARLWLAGLF